jgi:hypothetical protein
VPLGYAAVAKKNIPRGEPRQSSQSGMRDAVT